MNDKPTLNFNSLLMAGVLLAGLGLLAIAAPVVAGGAVVFVLGGLLLLTGMCQLFVGIQAQGVQGRWVAIVLGAITALGGLMVVLHPLKIGLPALTLVLAIYFLMEGVGKIAYAFSMRGHDGWFWFLFSGGITLLLGILIWSEWPSTADWAIGTLVGVNLLLTGAAMVAMALALKKTVSDIG